MREDRGRMDGGRRGWQGDGAAGWSGPPVCVCVVKEAVKLRRPCRCSQSLPSDLIGPGSDTDGLLRDDDWQLVSRICVFGGSCLAFPWADTQSNDSIFFYFFCGWRGDRFFFNCVEEMRRSEEAAKSSDGMEERQLLSPFGRSTCEIRK